MVTSHANEDSHQLPFRSRYLMGEHPNSHNLRIKNRGGRQASNICSGTLRMKTDIRGSKNGRNLHTSHSTIIEFARFIGVAWSNDWYSDCTLN